MKLRIERAWKQDKLIWLVHACGLTLSFADEASAVSFAAKLEERVDAPHQLPAKTLERWAAEHSRLRGGS
ncbi:hypothetical protein [Pseudomonas sp. SCB32]|uniref:hypothetical protein n=1 Tax=Pseudomonas sp. SCB32 TaxID=2653853 RepID=UPI00126546EE|nr:hypothetical protein [Pseudomonas sp. SCB32]